MKKYFNISGIRNFNKKLDKTGGEREVLKVLSVSRNHIKVLPPYQYKSIPKSSIPKSVLKRIKKGSTLLVNKFQEGKFVKEEYFV